MYPSSESIGTVFNGEDVMLAQLAQEKAMVNFESHELPAPPECKELNVPSLNNEGVAMLDKQTAERVINVARLACDTADQNLWLAKKLFIKRRHDRAEVEELQCISMEISSEQESVQQFKELYENTEACLQESENMFIDRGLSRQATDS
jgi:hypothetical protein